MFLCVLLYKILVRERSALATLIFTLRVCLSICHSVILSVRNFGAKYLHLLCHQVGYVILLSELPVGLTPSSCLQRSTPILIYSFVLGVSK